MQIGGITMSETDLNEEHNQAKLVSHPSVCPNENSLPVVPSCSMSDTCKGCGKLLEESELLKVDNDVWHVTCLRCCACALPLENFKTCFQKNGNYYCHHHYKELTQTCSHCLKYIAPQELVMRVGGKIYHYNHTCFACRVCFKPFRQGQGFFIDRNRLLCIDCAYAQSFAEKNECLEITPNKPGRPRKKKHTMTSRHINPEISMNFSTNKLSGSTERSSYQHSKTKRIRTSFKHDQLSTMKEYFEENHNPDAKQLMQLHHRTGLSKRVLQVWFQNARAKQRRNKLQREGSANKTVEPDSKDNEMHPELSLDSNCSDSLCSTIGTSPESDVIFQDSTGLEDFEESVLSYEEFSSAFRSSSEFSDYSFSTYVGTMTTLQSESSHTSSMTSPVETTHTITPE